MILTIAFLVMLGPAALCAAYLCRKSKALRRRREAWKQYAVALEVAYECELECQRTGVDDDYDASIVQGHRAAEAAATAASVLFHLGEYPDAHMCSPFLPSRSERF